MVWLFQYLVYLCLLYLLYLCRFRLFSLIFAWAYGRSWLSHVDEQSIMPINLFNLFDSFWIDPWSLVRWSLILDLFFSKMCGLRVEELPRASTMIEQWLLYTNWRQTQTRGLTIWPLLILSCLVTACVEMKPLRVPYVRTFRLLNSRCILDVRKLLLF